MASRQFTKIDLKGNDISSSIHTLHLPQQNNYLLKSNESLYTLIFNNCIENGLFPDSLKLADITSLHKMDEKTRKKNYRPVSVLPTVSKVFERIMDRQITAYISSYLSSLLCGFRKGYNTQHALIRMLEKWKGSLDNGENIGAILMDLSKAFDCIKHDLLLAKLDAYGFSREALSLVNSFWKTGSRELR